MLLKAGRGISDVFTIGSGSEMTREDEDTSSRYGDEEGGRGGCLNIDIYTISVSENAHKQHCSITNCYSERRLHIYLISIQRL